MCGMVLRSGSVVRSFVRSGTVRAVVFSRVSKTWQMSARWINEDEEKKSYKGGGGGSVILFIPLGGRTNVASMQCMLGTRPGDSWESCMRLRPGLCR